MTDYMNMPGVPKGSYAAGERVRIPAGAERPYTVFVNGIEQKEGEDFKVAEGELRFNRPIVKEKMDTGRWLAMYLGLFGTYRKDEKVDIHFKRGGKDELVADLPIVPYEDGEGPA
jgi:hypothetical protein